jgi:hypothetical protein
MLDEHIALGDAYQDQAATIVERQIAIGGIRLAAILNEAAKSAK